MNSFLNVLASIFFDTVSVPSQNISEPRDLTQHYKGEIILPAFDAVYIGTKYSHIEKSIEQYKYNSDRKLSKIYVDILANVVEKYDLGTHKDIALVGVPMHWSRYLIRGFDHIDRIVAELSHRIGIQNIAPLHAHFTKRQSKLSKKERLQNREDAYGLKSGVALPKNIIIIDDVISTGSTINACAKILKDAGVEKVFVVCIASNQ